MRKLEHVLMVLILALGYYACDAPGNVNPVFQQYFIKYYGDDGDQEGSDFVVNADGSIILLGSSTLGQQRRMYVVKVDAEGNELWKKTFGSDAQEFSQDIEPITQGPDAGNFVILSNVLNGNVVNNREGFDIRLTVINSNGDSLKSVLINPLLSQRGFGITPIGDGGYFLAGRTIDTDTGNPANASLQDPSSDEEDLLIIKLQSDFTYSSFDVSRIGGSYFGSAIKVFQQGSSFLYAGFSDEITGAEFNYEKNFIFRSFVDNPNSVSTFYTGTASRHEEMAAIARSPSGIFMAVGTQTNESGGDRQLFLSAVASNFSAALKEGTMSGLSGQTEGIAVAPSGTGKFLVLGNAINNVGSRDIYLSKINFFFEKDFELTFGAPGNNDTGSAVAELPNGDILLLGTMELTSQKKMVLIKLRSNGSF